MSINPSFAFDNVEKSSTPVYNGSWLYVGGNGTGNYTIIQDAIDNASDGDTVFVYDDSSPYIEYILVNKSINIVGENKETTVIEGESGGSTIRLVETASSVTIQGFTVTNGFFCLDIKSDSNTIIGNIFSNNIYNGVSIYESKLNHFINNTINTNGTGLMITSGKNNTIVGNKIVSNNYCISLQACYDNNISKNDLHNIHIGNSKKNIIESNNIETIYMLATNKNIIRKNNFIGSIRHVDCYISFFNKWDSNYWDDWIGLKFNMTLFQKFPKIIVCNIIIPLISNFTIPYFNFDWHPAQIPYDI